MYHSCSALGASFGRRSALLGRVTRFEVRRSSLCALDAPRRRRRHQRARLARRQARRHPPPSTTAGRATTSVAFPALAAANGATRRLLRQPGAGRHARLRHLVAAATDGRRRHVDPVARSGTIATSSDRASSPHHLLSRICARSKEPRDRAAHRPSGHACWRRPAGAARRCSSGSRSKCGYTARPRLQAGPRHRRSSERTLSRLAVTAQLWRSSSSSRGCSTAAPRSLRHAGSLLKSSIWPSARSGDSAYVRTLRKRFLGTSDA